MSTSDECFEVGGCNFCLVPLNVSSSVVFLSFLQLPPLLALRIYRLEYVLLCVYATLLDSSALRIYRLEHVLLCVYATFYFYFVCMQPY